MLLDKIIENPQKYGAGKKRISKEVIATDCDHDTGEIHSELNIEYAWVDKEPNYVKVYYGAFDLINSDYGSLLKYVFAFMEYMTYANHDVYYYRATVRASAAEKAMVAKKCNVSLARVEQALTELIKADIFIPVVYDGTRVRGTYFINPFVFARGDWSDVKQLRRNFDYGNTPTTTIIDSNKNRKTIICRGK